MGVATAGVANKHLTLRNGKTPPLEPKSGVFDPRVGVDNPRGTRRSVLHDLSEQFHLVGGARRDDERLVGADGSDILVD